MPLLEGCGGLEGNEVGFGGKLELEGIWGKGGLADSGTTVLLPLRRGLLFNWDSWASSTLEIGIKTDEGGEILLVGA